MSPFPTSSSSGHPLKHSTTLPSSPNLRTTVLRSRTVATDSPQQRSGFIDAGAGKEVEAKVVLLGTQSVGKTSFITRYTKREFRTGTESTISANISTRKNYVQGVKVKLQVSHTAASPGGGGRSSRVGSRGRAHPLRERGRPEPEEVAGPSFGLRATRSSFRSRSALISVRLPSLADLGHRRRRALQRNGTSTARPSLVTLLGAEPSSS